MKWCCSRVSHWKPDRLVIVEYRPVHLRGSCAVQECQLWSLQNVYSVHEPARNSLVPRACQSAPESNLATSEYDGPSSNFHMKIKIINGMLIILLASVRGAKQCCEPAYSPLISVKCVHTNLSGNLQLARRDDHTRDNHHRPTLTCFKLFSP